MLDIIIFVVLFLISFILTFCGCFQCAHYFPLLCSGECVCCSQCKSSVADAPNDSYHLEEGSPPSSDVGKPSQKGAGAKIAEVLTNPKAVAIRLVCALVTGYIFTIILLAILIVTLYPPYSPIDPADCKASCSSDDAYCCSYDSPLVTVTEDVTFQSGARNMHGWWIKGSGSSGMTVLYNHGASGNIAMMYRQQRYKFLTETLGVDLFVYDYPGYGKSEGSPSEENIKQSGRDALKWLETKSGKQAKDLLVLGRSMGSHVAVTLAVENNPMKGLILWSAFTSYKDAAEGYLTMFGWLSRSVWGATMDSKAIIGGSTSCLFESHSQADEWVPLSHGEKLFATQNSPANCKKWVEVKDPKHDDPLTDTEKAALVEWLSTLG